jgi:hypothetical protein
MPGLPADAVIDFNVPKELMQTEIFRQFPAQPPLYSE